MNPTALKGTAFLLLALAVACRKPAVLPTFDQVLNRAAATSGSQMMEADRPDYREGFLNGARMVEEAVKAGRKPFMPRFAQGPSAYVPTGPLPEGATIVEEALPSVEMDAATGLEFRPVHADFTAAFARGQVDGFQWSLARHPADLIHPKAPAKWPSAWEPWPRDGRALALAGDGANVDLIWTPGLLAWSIRERGFPARRNWRPVPAWMQPFRAALADTVFWIDTDKGALGLDLESGAIRRVVPAGELANDPTRREALAQARGGALEGEAGWKAYEQRWQAEADAARPQNLEAAAKGDSAAMLALAWGSVDGTEALNWFRKAAEQGNAQGMVELGTRLYQGSGVPENRDEAKAWFQKAAKAGNSAAAELLQGLFAPK